jgi:DMSO/TMAO reductase YedYZ heme-binding membrane subunit
MKHTYAVQHPAMSEPLMMDSEVERTPRALAAWASMYVLRHFDEMLPLDEFVAEEVTS